nr:hypothetical protein CPGR_03066 [Mycolicibacterium fortuitum subsp. fortuitum DSM 46621 = ATCC 6841 = JCM 6387]CRL77410.1 hypothetical protein CPGR_02014 [Mycolicibacter nonchromogenicus]
MSAGNCVDAASALVMHSAGSRPMYARKLVNGRLWCQQHRVQTYCLPLRIPSLEVGTAIELPSDTMRFHWTLIARRRRLQREAVLEALRGAGIPEEVLYDVPVLQAGVQGLLIYGSRARGDSIEGSDLDLLALSERMSPSTYSGLVNVSYYTVDQLKSGVGTLFGAHLRRDARIVWDPTGYLHVLVDELGEVDTARLFRRVKNMSTVFGALDADLPKYLTGLLREARYLLRSSLYAQAIAADQPCFSVREIAARLGDPSLARLLASRHVDPPRVADLRECLVRLEGLLGKLPPNPHGSLEALIVNEWDHGGDLLAIGFMALGLVGADGGYAEVGKILL